MALAAPPGGDGAKEPMAPPPNLPPLTVQIDKSQVDLEKRQLVVRMSRPARRVELKIYAESGQMLKEVSHSFEGKRAGAPLLVTWPSTGKQSVAKVEVFAYDIYEYFKGIAIVPWSFEIPHEELNFETNSAKILPKEEPKLTASLRLIEDALKKHQKLGTISLFIAGHTDTVGQPAHNKRLSQQRARAIAQWFRAHGLSLPIAYEGFGETAPKVKTGDEVAEAKNRRVDYVLSIEPPRFKTTRGSPAWKQI